MLRFFSVAIVVAGFLAASGLSAQSATVPTVPSPNQILSPGDQIRIVVWRKTEMSGDFQIAADGTIIHPIYREVQATGVPLATVEDRLRTLLSRYDTNPQFVIQALVKVVVAGEVRSPNVYPVPPETTVQQAVAMAGGPTERGLMNEVRIVRDRQELKVDLSRPASDAALLQIRSNDVILVGRRGTGIKDYIAPVTSTIAALVTIYTLITR